jgi:hypothetical protein
MKFVRVLVQSYWIPRFLLESGRNRWRSVKSSSSPVQSSPVESSFVLSMTDSPVSVQYVVKSSGVQWNPLESTGVHVDYVGEGKVLVHMHHSVYPYLILAWHFFVSSFTV